MSYDKTLEVHCYEITTNDKALNEDDEQHIEIQLWCFDKKSNPCLLRVRDFPCFTKVELPVLISRTGHITPWNNDLASDMVKAIKNRLKKCNKEEAAPTKWQYKLYHKLYYYSEKKSPFLLLIFNTVGAMYTTSQKCKFIDFMGIRRLELKFHEMNVDIFNKMFSIKDMGPTEKFTCKAKEINSENPERISKPGPLNRPFNEYVIDWHSIMPSKEAKWISHPRVCSFDIEVYSHKHRCFPQKQSAEDVIFSISIVTQEFMKPETRKDIMIIIGPTMGQEGVEIHYAKDEYEVIEKFYEIIEREDPDVFTGYNIFGFDYDYMNVRIEDVGLEWKNIGRLKEKGCEVKNKSWQSSAFGMMNMYILDCPGRISIDMMSYIKREHKLPKYSLDVVSRHFLGMKKVDLKPIEMFEIYQEMQVNIDNICKNTGCEDYREATKLIIGDPDKYLTKKEQKRFLKIVEKNTKIIEYNVIDSFLVIQLFEKLNVWISLIELANIVRINPTDCFTRGQQKRCVAQIYHTAYQNDVAMTKRDKNPIYYNGGHVEKPKPGLWDCVMCFDFNSLYPSIMIAYNICFTTLLRDKHVKIFPKEKQHYFHIEQEEPVGWKPGKKDNFDYGEYEDCVNGEDEKVEEEEGEKKDTIHREYDIAFVNKNVKKGLLPIILENLLKERKKKKNDMKIYEKIIELFDKNIIQKHKSKKTICVDDIDDEKTKKEFLNIFSEETTMKNFLLEFFNLKVQYGICDAQQLGLKISANSLYGFLGCQAVGEFSLIQAGMAVTGIGRQLIGKSAEYFEQNYGAITAYGDSVLFNEPLLLRNTEGIFIEEIGRLSKEWIPYEGFKVNDTNRKEKQQSINLNNLEIWSKGGWVKVKRVIRHKTEKKIYRINTHTGLIDVTEDHSLLNDNWEKIKPGDCEIGTTLAHSYPSDLKAKHNNFPNEIIVKNKKEAAEIYYLAKSSGLQYVISYNSENEFVLKKTDKNIDNKIKKIEIIHQKYTDFVYDIETENGFFQAGIGELNIKNTDSVMVHIPGLSREEMDAKAREMESDINGHPEIIDEKTGLVIAEAKKSIFPEPLVLEYEKGMYAIFMRKKMYIYMEIKNGKIVKIKGTDIDKIIYRGVMNARRDGCKFCTNLYERMVRDIFNGGTIKEVLRIILVEILKLLKLDLDIEEELTFIREMKSNYKSKTFSSAIYSELMKSIQRPINSGERFSYVIVNDYQCREKLGYKMRTYELFSEQWETSGFKYGDKIPLMWKSKVGLFPPEEIDCKYYITNKMIGPIDSLFYFSFFKVLDQYENVNYVPERRRLKHVNIGEPVAFVSQILEEYDDLIAKHGIKIMIPKIEALLKYVEDKM